MDFHGKVDIAREISKKQDEIIREKDGNQQAIKQP